MEVELKVGIFVTIGIVLVMLAILLLGSTENILSRKSHYTLHMNNVEGLIRGAKVMLGGIQIGTVDKLGFDEQHHDIQVTLNVTQESATHIKTDSEAEVATQGVLGDKYVSITSGSDTAPPLQADSDIPVRPAAGINKFLSQSDQLVARLNSTIASLDHVIKDFEAGNRSATFFQGMAQTARNLSSASQKLDNQLNDLKLKKIVGNLESITDKLNNGNGTLGALINDPGLYDNVKVLVGQANRNRILRNLVRQTIRESENQAAQAESSKKQQ